MATCMGVLDELTPDSLRGRKALWRFVCEVRCDDIAARSADHRRLCFDPLGPFGSPIAGFGGLGIASSASETSNAIWRQIGKPSGEVEKRFYDIPFIIIYLMAYGNLPYNWQEIGGRLIWPKH
jgi:hypothetical protein